MKEIARLHIRVLPWTFSSKLGEGFVLLLYKIVNKIGVIKTISHYGKVVGAISMFRGVILTLIVDPAWQRRGIGTKLVQENLGTLFVYTEEASLGFYKKLRFKEILKIGKTIFLWRKK